MSVGTPDFKPAQHIIDAVSEAASKPENYKYALADLPELLDAVSNHYAERYGVKGIRHEEIMSIYGSQEGWHILPWRSVIRGCGSGTKSGVSCLYSRTIPLRCEGRDL